MLTKQRVEFGIYSKYFPAFGGIHIGVDTHALRRSASRFYRYMTPELLVENLFDTISQDKFFDDRLMDLAEDESFVLHNAQTGLVFFCSYDISGSDQTLNLFIHTVIFRENGSIYPIYVDRTDRLLLKFCENGEVIENAPEFRKK